MRKYGQRLRFIAIALFFWGGFLGNQIQADDFEFLNFAFFNLPPEYFADIPLNDRPELFQELSANPESNAIDYPNHYFHLSAKGGEAEGKELWVRLLPRDYGPVQNPYSHFVLVHTATSNENADDAGEKFRTAALMWRKQKWNDVTSELIPKEINREWHLQPVRKYPGIKAYEHRQGKSPSQKLKQLLVWEDNRFQVRTPYPFSSSYHWDAPFDPEALAVKALNPGRNNRTLAQLIVHAGMVKDERFRYLLAEKAIAEDDLLALALASYRYSLDQDEAALEFILKRVAEEGRGDTNSKWMMVFFDEWDKTIEAHYKYHGTDGAAAEAGYMFVKQREYFYPENFARFWKRKTEAIKAKK